MLRYVFVCEICRMTVLSLGYINLPTYTYFVCHSIDGEREEAKFASIRCRKRAVGVRAGSLVAISCLLCRTSRCSKVVTQRIGKQPGRVHLSRRNLSPPRLLFDCQRYVACSLFTVTTALVIDAAVLSAPAGDDSTAEAATGAKTSGAT
jgi:hypothetical protein